MPHSFGSTVVRLSDEERETLKILIAALRISEYTDVVDDIANVRTARKATMESALTEFAVLLCGLCLAAHKLDPAQLAKLKSGAALSKYDVHPLLTRVFEVGRRYKRMNPSQFTEYGKLVMILQDVANPSIAFSGGVSLVEPITTVERLLGEMSCVGILEEQEMDILVDPSASPAARDAARRDLLDAYGGDANTNAVIERCLRSIEDATHFIATIRAPIATLLRWLTDIYQSDSQCLAITARRGGAVLTHSHESHYRYVRESLILWDIIMRDIFEFWECVEKDMLQDDRGAYHIMNTGQGYHRVSPAPSTRWRMEAALAEAERTAGGWVGIKVIHLGDRDVPNALVFINKYTAIPRMLQPIVAVVERLQDIFEARDGEYPGLAALIAAKYESYGKLRHTVLVDFFKHAFDGSGDDGGSCIDGRLTSAWNWCQELSKKPYYQAFVLAGFQGFD